MSVRGYLSPDQARLEIPGEPSVWTLADWRKRGTGPAFHRIAGKIFYARADIEKWISDQRFSSTSAYSRRFRDDAASTKGNGHRGANSAAVIGRERVCRSA